MDVDYKTIVEAAISEDSSDLTEVLTEALDIVSEERREHFYMMMIEQLMDERSCYAYDGWSKGAFYGAPRITAFHVEVDIILPKNTDINAAARLIGKNNENKIRWGTLANGTKILRAKFLRSVLDDLEQENRKRAQSDAQELGYKPPPQPEQQPGPF